MSIVFPVNQAPWTGGVVGGILESSVGGGDGGGPSSPLLNDLIEWWELNESGGGNRAGAHAGLTLTNGGGVSSTTGHVHTNAALFQGASTTDYLSRSASDFITPQGTVAFWCNPNSPNDWILHVGNAIAGELEFYTTGTNGKQINFRVNNDTSPAAYAFDPSADGEWKCVIGSWNTTNAWLYCFAASDSGTGTSSGSYNAITGAGTFTVGERLTSGQNFDGELGPFVLAGRVWSADDRALFYNGGAGISYPG